MQFADPQATSTAYLILRHLYDGDILECGGTFLVMRRAGRMAIKPEANETCPEALRTLSPSLEHEFSVLRKVARSPTRCLCSRPKWKC